MVDSIKIATVNCRGLATLSKRQDVLNFYKTKGYSIICFQDTHFIPEFEQCIEAMWGYKCYFNSYKSNARGVSIFFNNNFEFKVHQERKDKAENLTALDLTIEENTVTLINIYDCAHEKRVLMAFFLAQFQIFMDLYLNMSED